MRVVIAPDCFSDTLTAPEAADAMAAGWRAHAPDDELVLVPLADGGTGFLDVLAARFGSHEGVEHALTVQDPLGRPVVARLLLTGGDAAPTAWIESAEAIGRHLLTPDERDAGSTTTAGLGELLAAALDAGARRIVVGLGGSATNDGGAGMLGALGAGPAELLCRGGAPLADLRPEDHTRALPGLAAVRDRFRGVDLVVATDVDNPLLGLQGASATFAEQKGATPEQAQQLERALGQWHTLVATALPPPTDLLAGRPQRLDRAAGAGAAGGVGYALLALGGRRRSGVELVLDELGLRDLLADGDLVLTGEGCFDWQSLHGKVVAGVAALALEVGIPSVVVAGQVLAGRREAMNLGLSGCYAVAETAGQVPVALADPAGTLAARVTRVARTWSPRR